jgi:hypothetical protein
MRVDLMGAAFELHPGENPTRSDVASACWVRRDRTAVGVPLGSRHGHEFGSKEVAE